MMDAYSVIAKIYDYANTDFDYPKYFEFTKHYLTGEVVELACGSGAFRSAGCHHFHAVRSAL